MDFNELIDSIVKYENGELSQEEEIKLFQYLVDTNEVWGLQGHYGRHAEALIEAGLVHLNNGNS